jgi:hypothetical protein
MYVHVNTLTQVNSGTSAAATDFSTPCLSASQVLLRLPAHAPRGSRIRARSVLTGLLRRVSWRADDRRPRGSPAPPPKSSAPRKFHSRPSPFARLLLWRNLHGSDTHPTSAIGLGRRRKRSRNATEASGRREFHSDIPLRALISFPLEHWQQLIDSCRFRPSRDSHDAR